MYTVKINQGNISIIDANGNTVPNSFVNNIIFPNGKIHTQNGILQYINSKPFAEISVNGKVYSGVPVI